MKPTRNAAITKPAPVVTLNQLSPEDKKALMLEFEQQQAEEAKRIQKERAAYKTIVDGEVKRLYPALAEVSKALSVCKDYVFNALKELIATKAELYDREDDQNRHMFSTTEGDITIEIGYNVQDNWDDTVNTGIAKINDYMRSVAKDKDSALLVEGMMKLLSKDAKGNLKASRVLQLKQMADKSENKGFIDGVSIIQASYKPSRTKEFIRCIIKDAKGDKIILPLSITEAPMGEAHPLTAPGDK